MLGSGDGGAPRQAKGRGEAGPDEARGCQALPPTPEPSWGDPRPRRSAFQPQSRAWDALTSAVTRELESRVGCTQGPA